MECVIFRDTENSTDAEVAVQQYVASIIRWKSLIDNFFPLIFVIFAGAWSDIYGRKLLMVLPIFGYLAQTIGVLFCLGNPNTSAYTVAVVASLPVALTGSIATFNLAIFSYIADMTPLGSRTVRTGITNAAYLMGMSSGNALGGFLSSTSFVGVLAISGILDAIAFIWILFIIQNDTPRRLNKLNSSQQNKGMLVKVKRIFHFKNVLEAVRTVLKRRDGNDRLKIFMLIFACYFFITVPEYGKYIEPCFSYCYYKSGLISTYNSFTSSSSKGNDFLCIQAKRPSSTCFYVFVSTGMVKIMDTLQPTNCSLVL